MSHVSLEKTGDPMGLGLPTSDVVRVRLETDELATLRKALEILTDVIDKITSGTPIDDNDLFDRDDQWYRAAHGLTDIVERDATLTEPYPRNCNASYLV